MSPKGGEEEDVQNWGILGPRSYGRGNESEGDILNLEEPKCHQVLKLLATCHTQGD